MFKGNRVGTPFFLLNSTAAFSTAANPFVTNVIGQAESPEANIANLAPLQQFQSYMFRWTPAAEQVIASNLGIYCGVNILPQATEQDEYTGMEISIQAQIWCNGSADVWPFIGLPAANPLGILTSVELGDSPQPLGPIVPANNIAAAPGIRCIAHRSQLVFPQQDIGLITIGFALNNSTAGDVAIHSFYMNVGTRLNNNLTDVQYVDHLRN